MATLTTNPVEAAGLRRVRWAVRATLAVGVAASVSANVLHAARNPVSQVIAGWPPVALLLTVELISRVPTHRPVLAVVRMSATTIIAGIAAYVSYWHMTAVAARFGETGVSAYLLPISVDGLVVVASVCLVEIAGRLRMVTPELEPTPVPGTAVAGDVVTAMPTTATPARSRSALVPVVGHAFGGRSSLHTGGTGQ
jgi:hypothetical protein